ncbi:hypothetical protein D3C87_2023910 [compost metagenome]
MGDGRVIGAGGVVAAEIRDGVALGKEPGLEGLLEVEAGVVTAERDAQCDSS